MKLRMAAEKRESGMLHKGEMGSPPDVEEIEKAVQRSMEAVQRWVEQRNYKGYDPGDGLTSWARPMTFGNQFA